MMKAIVRFICWCGLLVVDSSGQHLRHMRAHGRNRKKKISPSPSPPREDAVVVTSAADPTAPFIPQFVKFHKVGSGFGSELFRRHCRAASRWIHYDTDNNTQQVFYPWLGVQHRERCARFPHGHGSLEMYRRGGLQKFVACTVSIE